MKVHLHDNIIIFLKSSIAFHITLAIMDLFTVFFHQKSYRICFRKELFIDAHQNNMHFFALISSA